MERSIPDLAQSNIWKRSELKDGTRGGDRMTDEQKERIDKLRAKDFSYKQVADAIGVSINTVKSYCRRQKEKAEEPESKERAGEAENPKSEDIKTKNTSNTGGCRYCGRPLIFTPGKRKKTFCNKECRTKYWTEHRDDLPHKTIYTFRCAHCGKEFTVYGKRERKYCSPECYFAERFGVDEARSKVSGDDADHQKLA